MDLGSSYVISQGLFIKLLAVNYLCAFVSLLVQIKGLYGVQGISPVSDLLNRCKRIYKEKAFTLLPTLFWVKSSDRTLLSAAWIGIAFSVLCLMGFYPSLFLLGMWLIYYSFYNVGAPFLSFQWDILLLEVGGIGLLFAIQSPPPMLFVYLLWFVLFRFMFSSGYKKLVCGSQEWRNLTAMAYHYETQPLPTQLGYYAHQLPLWFSKASVMGIYFFEIVVPIFIFMPDEVRLVACLLLIFLQLLIAATGNYAFFNLLSITMCVPLVPDRFLTGLESIAAFQPLIGENLVVYILISIAAGMLLLVNILEFATLFAPVRMLNKILDPFQRFCCALPYGLFIRMTSQRDEIIIEGSDDMENWKEYEFRWKPGDPHQPPRLVAPHQPRLDWQMWFAALTSYHQAPWFEHFLHRLLEGSDDVIKLLKTNPFPDAPPKYIRAHLYRYRFTDLSTKRKTGAWWTRTYVRPYTPVLSLIEHRA